VKFFALKTNGPYSTVNAEKRVGNFPCKEASMLSAPRYTVQ